VASSQIPIPQKIPENTLESLLTAPLDKFKADRVKDPEAGIPLKKAHPIFATPDPKISLLSLGRSPVRDAIDLVTTEISSVTKKANPNATPESSEILLIKSEGSRKTLRSGRKDPPLCFSLNVSIKKESGKKELIIDARRRLKANVGKTFIIFRIKK
tara:strand:+ start:308 stop:778 length:471 start_codon:yes stop_codon:yes gene_type:complete